MNQYIESAYKEAIKAKELGEVPVGAVIVKNGKIIAKAHNLREKKKNTLAHAEILCIDKACKKIDGWRLDNCEMYITLEPCMMCCGAIAQSRISKIYFCALDDKNGCVITKANILDVDITHKVEYEYIEDKRCSEILKDFFKKLREKK